MSFDQSNTPPTGTGAILRALGTLIAALGGDEVRQQPAPTFTPAAPVTPSIQRAPATPRSSAEPLGGTPTSEAEIVLSEARDRAERILRESMERANDLLARERTAVGGGTAAPGDLDAVRRSIDDLNRGMREVQARLDRIEAILAARASAPVAAAPAPTPPLPPRPVFPAPGEDERRPGVLSVVSPQPAPARPAPPPYAPPPAPAAPPSVVPPSAVPPMRAAQPSTPPPAVPFTPPAAAAPAEPEPYEPESYEPEIVPTPPPAPEPRVERAETLPPQAARRGQREEEPAGTLATFTPSDGSVLLRAAPVSGFQGLMRLQDALQRIPAVRQATVEAYSQGEARLRLELASDVDSDEIAEGVGAGLGQSAQVRAASEADRNIIIAFG